MTYLKFKITEPIQANEVFKAILLFLVIDLAHVSWRCRVIFEVEGNAARLAHAPVSTIDQRVDLVLSDHVIYQYSIFQVRKKKHYFFFFTFNAVLYLRKF